MKRLRSFILLTITTAASGCSLVYEGKYDWDEGWRVGRIVRVGTAAEMKDTRLAGCIEGLMARFPPDRTVALVAYPAGRVAHRMVAPLLADSKQRPGDEVYVKRRACDTPVVARQVTASGQP